jgi:flavin reductase (DIM6/NTAB) family NADH-FMN oxidoreductase RutF
MTSASIDTSTFRRACSKFATGITVTTLSGDDGKPHGMTINSFTSVSLRPALVLVCVDLSATMLPLLTPGRHFGINVLSAAQKDIAGQFASKVEDRFHGIPWVTGKTGVPLIRDVLASFECVVDKVVEAGDHVIVVGEVLHVDHADGQPLLYFSSGYNSLP